MILSDDDIKNFQALFERELGKKIDKQEAYAKAVKLLRLIEIIYRPLTQDEVAQIEERRQKTPGSLKKRINGP